MPQWTPIWLRLALAGPVSSFIDKTRRPRFGDQEGRNIFSALGDIDNKCDNDNDIVEHMHTGYLIPIALNRR